MKAILTADADWGIGKNGNLLVHNPVDMRFFRETTLHQAVLMGRKTLESYPGGKPLPNRTNIVLTRNPDYEAPEGVIVVHGRAELSRVVSSLEGQELWVIGGGEIYAEFLPDCESVLVTELKGSYGADVFFPDLNQLSEWRLEKAGPWQTHEDLTFRFCEYKRA